VPAGIRGVVGTAYFNGPVNIFTGQTQTRDIVTNKPENQYNFGDVHGNVAAGSENFTQVYQQSVDIEKVRELIGLLTEGGSTLDLGPDDQAELESGVKELEAAAAEPAFERSCLGRALERVARPLRKAGPSVIARLALTMSDEIARGLGEELGRQLPH
jgi:hypothetical protein